MPTRAKMLSRDQLEALVTLAQTQFWLRLDDNDEPIWDPDTEWSWERMEAIAGAFADAGLKPADIHVIEAS
jgi:hypothetical protein